MISLLVSIIVTLVIFGVIFEIVRRVPFIPEWLKQILYLLIGLMAFIYILSLLGVISGPLTTRW